MSAGPQDPWNAHRCPGLGSGDSRGRRFTPISRISARDNELRVAFWVLEVKVGAERALVVLAVLLFALLV